MHYNRKYIKTINLVDIRLSDRYVFQPATKNWLGKEKPAYLRALYSWSPDLKIDELPEDLLFQNNVVLEKPYVVIKFEDGNTKYLLYDTYFDAAEKYDKILANLSLLPIGYIDFND